MSLDLFLRALEIPNKYHSARAILSNSDGLYTQAYLAGSKFHRNLNFANGKFAKFAKLKTSECEFDQYEPGRYIFIIKGITIMYVCLIAYGSSVKNAGR